MVHRLFSLYIIHICVPLACFSFQLSQCTAGSDASFFVSTSKIFKRKQNGIPIQVKYVVYVLYQLILLLIVSSIGQWLADIIIQLAGSVAIIAKLSKVFAKVLITPVTMLANFGVMKFLTEKI